MSQKSGQSDIVVSNTASRQFVIEMVHGNILDVEAQALVIGIYEGVLPGGAADAIDAVIGDEIAKAFNRGMFSGRIGEIYFLPCQRRGLAADFVILAGLGNVNDILSREDGEDNIYARQEEALQTVGANVVRAMIASRISHVATVLMGASTGVPHASIVRNLTTGIVSTLMTEDQGEIVSKVSICELKKDVFDKIGDDVRELMTRNIPSGLNVRLATRKASPIPRVGVDTTSRSDTWRPYPRYLFTTGELVGDDGLMVRSVFFGSNDQAAVFEHSKFVSKSFIDAELEKIRFEDAIGVKEIGAKISAAVLPPEIAKALRKTADPKSAVIIVNDVNTSFIPWEIIKVGPSVPSLKYGMSRLLYKTPNMGMEQYSTGTDSAKKNVLLITDPTDDLPGAVQEVAVIKSLLDDMTDRFTYHELAVPGATDLTLPNKKNIVREIKSGQYDIVHYAGHAFFEPTDRGNSGLMVNGGEVVTGADLRNIDRLPKIFFFNACESGRVRKVRGQPAEVDTQVLSTRERIDRSVGIAESIISSGVEHFVGTYWPVGDAAAKEFAKVFYKALMDRKSISDAMLKGRQALYQDRDRDWADYIHYGNPHDQLFQG